MEKNKYTLCGEDMEDLAVAFACFESYSSIEEFVRCYDVLGQDKYVTKILKLFKDGLTWEQARAIILSDIKEDVINKILGYFL